MIEFSHICKSFQGKEVLHDVSLEINKHQTLCIIGESGSGKTTLLRCLAGLDDECEVSHETKISMVFQNFNLFENLTVLQNLTFALIHVLNMEKKDADDFAMEYLKMVGMSEKTTLYPSQLSSGQKQRVAIARCLVMKPSVLILDEPLSSLDPISRGEVMDILRKLKKEITLIMVLNDIDSVAELADRVVFMKDGYIYEDGTTEQVLTSPKKAETRHFISCQRNLLYTINSVDFDRPELNARIEHYCNRFGFGAQAYRFVQLAVEELLNLIPLDNKVEVVLSKFDNEVRMSLDFSFNDRGFDYLSEDNVSDDNFISFNILKGLCDVIEESVENKNIADKQRYIHLELNQDRLLYNTL